MKKNLKNKQITSVIRKEYVFLQMKICGNSQKLYPIWLFNAQNTLKRKTDEQGIVTMDLFDFLLDSNSI